MEQKSKNIGVTDIILLVISILFFIGSITLFKPCDPMEDGSWMTCHWAGVVVAGLAGVLVVLSIIHLILKDARTKTGLSIAMLPVSLLAIFIPGTLIHLCMMNTMRCHSVTQPATIIFSVIIIIVAVIDVLMNRKKHRDDI